MMYAHGGSDANVQPLGTASPYWLSALDPGAGLSVNAPGVGGGVADGPSSHTVTLPRCECAAVYRTVTWFARVEQAAACNWSIPIDDTANSFTAPNRPPGQYGWWETLS